MSGAHTAVLGGRGGGQRLQASRKWILAQGRKASGSESNTNPGAWEVVGCPADVETDSLMQCGFLDI